MKQTKHISLIVIVAALLLAFAGRSNALETTNLLGALNLGDGVHRVYTEAQKGGIFSATNYAVEPYFTYAPKLKSGDKYGAGILAVYNFNQYTAGGLGVDYLGRFSLVSGNVTVRYPINVGSRIDRYLPDSWVELKKLADSIEFVPFVLGGLGTPLSGSDKSVATILDAGGYVQFGSFAGGKFNAGLCYGQWNNSGDYSGKRYHAFLGWSYKF